MPQKTLSGNVYKYASFAIIAILLLTIFQQSCQNIKLKKDITELYSEHTLVLDELAIEKNETINITELYEMSLEDISILNTQLAALKQKPKDIQYIVKTETKIIEKEKIVYTELPDEYLFKGANNLVVARFGKEAPEEYETYIFETFDVVLSGNLIITETDSALSLFGTSSYDPEFTVELPVNLSVSRLRKPQDRFLQPTLHLGMQINLEPDIRPLLGFSTMHYKDFEFGTLTVSASSKESSIGLTPVLYNIGTPLPLLHDLNIGIGAELNSKLTVGPYLLLTTEL